MKTPKTALVALTLTALGMGAVILPPQALPTALAQDQQGPPPPMDNGQGGPPPPQQDAPPPPGGGFGGPPPNGGGFGGGGRRQFGGGRAPFALGTVVAVDPTAQTITITPQFGGTDNQTIHVSSSTQISSQITASVSDLKAGDQVQVQGVPTGITASSLTVGQNPLAAAMQGGRGGFGGGGFGGGRAGGQGGGTAQTSFAQATGTVTSTSPLTIALSGGVSLTLKLTADAKVTKYSTVALSGIKVGDRIMSMGQTGDDGTFTASTVGVNMQMGGPGMGGRGGFGRGGGGFGGGGFGGGGFGRRGGGGQHGGDNPPPPVSDGQG